MLEKFSNELVLVKTNEQKQRRLGRRRVKGYKKSTKASKGAHSHGSELPPVSQGSLVGSLLLVV